MVCNTFFWWVLSQYYLHFTFKLNQKCIVKFCFLWFLSKDLLVDQGIYISTFPASWAGLHNPYFSRSGNLCFGLWCDASRFISPVWFLAYKFDKLYATNWAKESKKIRQKQVFIFNLIVWWLWTCLLYLFLGTESRRSTEQRYFPCNIFS